LITLVAHYTLVRVFLAKGPVPEVHCRAWFLALFITMTSLILVLDAILFLRVYALHSKNKKTFLLVVPILAQLTPAGLSFWYIFRQSTFDYKCDFRNPKQIQFVLQGVTVIVAHASLWMASFAKRNTGRGPYTILVKMVVHEGLWAFFLLFAIVGGVVPTAYVSRSANPFIIFVWPICIVSVTICRLIMNMRRLKVETVGTAELHLSTIAGVSESSMSELTDSIQRST